jgi:hypothetical protein
MNEYFNIYEKVTRAWTCYTFAHYWPRFTDVLIINSSEKYFGHVHITSKFFIHEYITRNFISHHRNFIVEFMTHYFFILSIVLFVFINASVSNYFIHESGYWKSYLCIYGKLFFHECKPENLFLHESSYAIPVVFFMAVVILHYMLIYCGLDRFYLRTAVLYCVCAPTTVL